ncbi:MAG: hypothetical protein ACI8ZO_000830 [Flavobacteriales bacterium]|jgi:hypothetical protein
MNVSINVGFPNTYASFNLYSPKKGKHKKIAYPFVGIGLGADQFYTESGFIVIPVGLRCIYPNGFQWIVKGENFNYFSNNIAEAYPDIFFEKASVGISFGFGYRF